MGVPSAAAMIAVQTGNGQQHSPYPPYLPAPAAPAPAEQQDKGAHTSVVVHVVVCVSRLSDEETRKEGNIVDVLLDG